MLKKLLFSTILCSILTSGFTQNVSIPDANFKANLLANTAINTNSDAEIQISEAVAFNGTINCANSSISDLTGIEAFINLTSLFCFSNNISTIDVSQNTALINFNCRSNNLTVLDVSQNTNLEFFICHTNNLAAIDVSQNTALVTLECYDNVIEALDISQNTALTELECQSNALTSLNAANTNNTNFLSFNATNNSGLTCIQVDDVAYSDTNWPNKDAGASYSLSCGPACVVSIPDANFKANLLANTAINTNSDGEIQCSEAIAFNGTINCANSSISDLTGIEAFINLTSLFCFSNTLSTIDVSQNTALINFNCRSNNLTVLDVSQNTNLEFFICHTNNLAAIDVSQNTALVTLECYNNVIEALDISQNTALTELECQSNALTSLNAANTNNTNFLSFNATNNSGLTCIQVDDVAYSDTNWPNKDAGASYSLSCGPACVVSIPDANFKANLLANTAINTNSDGEIQCSEAIAFNGTINCANSSISDLTGIEAFINLTSLFCFSNNISTIDVSQNTALINFNCQGNNLTTLDVSQNINLDFFLCHTNNLTALDVSQNTALVTLECYNNSIDMLDISQSTGLRTLECQSNALTSLNAANTNNTNFLSFNATNNSGLTCIQVDDVAYSDTNWPNKDAGANYSLDCTLLTVPDADFKAVLLANTAINTNSDGEIQNTEAAAYTGIIDCSNSSISDMSGIEAFTNLTGLDCFSNNITTLDVSQNTALVSLNCRDNNLTVLDVSQNAVLETLRCDNNIIEVLDISPNIALRELDCQSNALTSLNVANTNNTNFIVFNAINNSSLSCIQVDDVAYSNTNWTNKDAMASFNLNCNALGLIDFDISKIKIYPNPFNSQLFINGLQKPGEVKIYDLYGKLLLKSLSYSIDTNKLSSGVYLMTIDTDNGKISKKIIKE